jgi:hypothetical protein
VSDGGWIFVDSSGDLRRLNNNYYWGDGAETREFYGCQKFESYFPSDVSLDGGSLNVHLLVELTERQPEDPRFLELVLIGCDRMALGFLQHPHFVGRIDSLKRVYLDDDGRETRCCRLIYRLIAQDLSLYDLAYFKTADSIS